MEVFLGTLFGLANGYVGDLSSCSRKSINQFGVSDTAQRYLNRIPCCLG